MGSDPDPIDHTTDGTIYVDANGQMQVNGWDDITTDIANAQSNITGLQNTKADKTTTVNNHPLSSNVVVTKGDVGLGSVIDKEMDDAPTANSDNYVESGGVFTAIKTVQDDIDAHESNTSNPHSVTKAQVGLGNVDNTSDADKPISTATQTALNDKVTGPSSSVSDNVVLFDGTTGKLVKDSGKTLGASIPAPSSSVSNQALIVNQSGDGYIFGEAGKVDDIKVNNTSVVQNKVADITTGTGLQSTSNEISHVTSGVTAGTYQSVTVNQLGHVTDGSNIFEFRTVYLEEVD